MALDTARRDLQDPQETVTVVQCRRVQLPGKLARWLLAATHIIARSYPVVAPSLTQLISSRARLTGNGWR